MIEDQLLKSKKIPANVLRFFDTKKIQKFFHLKKMKIVMKKMPWNIVNGEIKILFAHAEAILSNK